MESEEDPSSLHGGRVGLTTSTAPRCTNLLKQTSETAMMDSVCIGAYLVCGDYGLAGNRDMPGQDKAG